MFFKYWIFNWCANCNTFYKMSLSAKHKLFCDEYLANGLNATQAYKSVYKTNDKIAGASGPRLLENVRVKEYLKENNTHVRL